MLVYIDRFIMAFPGISAYGTAYPYR